MKPNLAPWRINEDEFPRNQGITQQARFLIRYALLAPSSHNTQPWLFSVSDNHIDILLDHNRIPPFGDRTHREAIISLGCAITNLQIAAKHFKLEPHLELFPESKTNATQATLTLKPNQKKVTKSKNVRFKQITQRRTNRFPHQDKPIPKELITTIKQLGKQFGLDIRLVDSSTDKNELAEIMADAISFAFGNQLFKWELSHWIRSVYTNKPDGIPLYDIGAPSPLTIFAPFMIKYLPASVQVGMDKKLIKHSSSIVIIQGKQDDKITWLKTGQCFQLISLKAHARGIATAPMAAIIEHEPSRKKLQQFLNTKWLPIFFTRLGYPTQPTSLSPRRDIDEVLLKPL